MLTTYACGGEACQANGSFIGLNQLSITSIGCLSGGCDAANNRQFTIFYNQFFHVAHAGNPIFDYTIVTTLSNVSILTITNELGDIAIYTNASASVSDIEIPGLTLYPNPVSNELFVEMKNEFLPVSYEIFNLAGQQVIQTKLNTNIIKVSNLDTGRYFIRFLDDNGRQVADSFVIKR